MITEWSYFCGSIVAIFYVVILIVEWLHSIIPLSKSVYTLSPFLMIIILRIVVVSYML